MQRKDSARWVRWGQAHPGWLLVGVLVVYFLAGRIGLHFAFVHAAASPVWPPSGIALAAVLLFGQRTWTAIFVGAFLVNSTIVGPSAASLGIAVGNTLEAVVGGFLMSRFAPEGQTLRRPADFVRFIALTGLVSTPIAATFGATSLALAGQAEWTAFGAIWLTWWLGDAAGALIVAPLLLLWGLAPAASALRERPAEAVLLLAVVATTAALVFAAPELSRYPLPFLCIPPLIWAAFRFGPREVATSVALLSAIATWATVRGSGPFDMGNDNESLLLLQAFMATIVALTLPVAALVWQRKAIERERSLLLERERAARAEAEAANHARDEFLAMLSHELRNPLAAISNAAEVMLMPGRAPPFPDRAAEIVSRQARHLGRLIEDLLDVARATSGKMVLVPERLDLAELVQRSLAVFRAGGRLSQHQVTENLACTWVEADPVRLSQVVDNLLVNAIKFTPPGGRIDVQTTSDDDNAVLHVRDSGIGMTPDLLPRVFDLFTQGPRSLDRSQGGLGIGLTLAHRIVLAHGGRIEAASAGPSKGCTFCVRLPRIESPAASASPPREDRSAKPSAKRILIIEDDPDGREALRMQLVTAGHDVYEAASGMEGIEAAARVKPEIVLLDIGLPGVDGYQVAQRLKGADGCPRLIAITGYGQQGDRERSIRAGIDQHLVKPVDAVELGRLLA
ncbi:MAG: hybrid sensor histidine kinase/response regulator [Burkholderiaceae bacterium]